MYLRICLYATQNIMYLFLPVYHAEYNVFMFCLCATQNIMYLLMLVYHTEYNVFVFACVPRRI